MKHATDRLHSPFLGLLVALGFLFLSACSKEPFKVTFPEREVKAPANEEFVAGALLEGTVFFAGTAPKRYPVRMGSDPACSESHDGPPLSENVVVTDGRLKDVLIYIKSGLERWTFPFEKSVAVIDQTGCLYKPYVTAVQAYQPVEIKNSDSTSHNVHYVGTKSNEGFNNTTSSKGSKMTWQFKNPELNLPIKCDVHPWMQAFVHVLPHPYFALSAEDGSFAMPMILPGGKYVVEAVHPTLGKRTANLEIKQNENESSVRLDFNFSE